LGRCFAPERLATTARFFLDLAVVPFLLRALFEGNPKTLQAEIGPYVALRRPPPSLEAPAKTSKTVAILHST
jgi:hypothetical protein